MQATAHPGRKLRSSQVPGQVTAPAQRAEPLSDLHCTWLGGAGGIDKLDLQYSALTAALSAAVILSAQAIRSTQSAVLVCRAAKDLFLPWLSRSRCCIARTTAAAAELIDGQGWGFLTGDPRLLLSVG